MTSMGRFRAVLYGGAALLLSVLFVQWLRPGVSAAMPENDLWWMVPWLNHDLSGRSFWQGFGYLLSPAPLQLGQPALKLYLAGVIHGLGRTVSQVIWFSIGLHFLNAALLYGFSRLLGVGRRAGLLSGLVYLTLLVHFHAYWWPTASQHLMAVTTILALLTLFLRAEKQFSERNNGGWFYPAVLAMTLMASLQRSTVLAPVFVLAHVIVCSNGPEERIRRFDRWLPLWFLYLVYPAVALTVVGDPEITIALSQGSLPAGMRAVLLLGAGALFLSALRAVVRAWPRIGAGSRRGFIGLAGTAVLFFWAGLVLQDSRQVFLPYNAVVPFLAVFTSFLDPLQAVLRMDPSEPFHYVSAQISVFSLFLGGLWVGLFLADRRPERKPLLLLLVCYGICALYVLPSYSYSSFPLRVPSRYFIYFTPVFSILFCSVAVRLADGLLQRTRVNPLAMEVFLVLLFVGLCVSNLLAIRVEIFRGRLANTYLVYEEIRTAQLIREDLHQRGPAALPGEILFVNGVSPMPFREITPFVAVDPEQHDSFRMIAAEVLKDADIRVNVPAGTEGRVYTIDGERILDRQGAPIDLFTRLLDQAVQRMREGRKAEAFDLFYQAAQTRPFLLRYLLQSYRLEDLRWITRDLDLRGWIHRVDGLCKDWSDQPIPKRESVFALVHQEISDYLVCLFCLSYLEHHAGNEESSQRWLSQIHYLERDPAALVYRLMQVPWIAADPDLKNYAQRLNGSSYFSDPLPWRKDDYGFGRFLVRLLWSWDIRSGWDKRLGFSI